ncbi:hypothetical protein [Yoonia sp.]|uniref:hypothetical protein n=1 Tax=Yoonia sp. TaxID=2212373 RepID=UPI0025E03B37|nr:hypothetical protein [Yoonia sp.]
MTPMLRNFLLAAVCVASAALLWLLATTGTYVLGQSGSAIVAQNTSYLQDASRDGLQDMLLIAEILGLLEVLSTTEVGLTVVVSVSAEAGQALSALTHVMERVLGVATLATGTAEAMLGLNRAAAAASFGLAQLSLGLGAGYFVFRGLNIHNRLQHLAHTLVRMATMLFLIAYLVIPYSINASGWLANQIAEPGDPSAVQVMHDRTVKRNLSNDPLKYWSDAEHLTRGFKDTINDLPQKLSLMTTHYLGTLIHLLLVGIGFPLLAAALMILVIRRMFDGPPADDGANKTPRAVG